MDEFLKRFWVERIITIPTEYADGYNRVPSNKGMY